MNPRLTVSLPCFGRPERTKRSIANILAQNINGWEAIILGDACPHFQKLITSGYMFEMSLAAAAGGNRILYHNFPEHTGHCGYNLTNFAISRAKGKYLIFYANDDIILPNHFNHYLEIESTDLDYMYFNTYLAPAGHNRISQLAPCQIGHSEIIVKTSLAKKAKPHRPIYGHDWDFIKDIIQGGKGKKSEVEEITYHVMRMPNHNDIETID
jgi:hypothetical protein